MHKSRFLLLLVPFLFLGCGTRAVKRTIIWTNNPEFAQYIELYNRKSSENAAVLVYKENPADSLPPAKDELPPDIIISSYLNTEKPEQYFKPLDYLFDYQRLSSSDFYEDLLNVGHKNSHQYLLPVSFNLPLLIFSGTNESRLHEQYMMSLKSFQDTAVLFNETTKSGAFSKMGFTPSASEDFSYLVTKLMGTDFHEENGSVLWDDNKLQASINYLKNWTNNSNGGLSTEEDFAYKYLFMPSYRRITSGRTLFSYTTSDDLFKYLKDDSLNISYRWIIENGNIPIEDSYLMMGVYKGCQNQAGATDFITWFLNTDNQRTILERKLATNLDTEMFGIAGGFSAVREVNERILPLYYKQLLGNLPPSSLLTVPKNLPAKWESYKKNVIIPYVKESIKKEEKVDIQTYITEWEKGILN
ncbi:MAG: extracellular solute-binding protein [Treponema sp.]|nr:extracellular solute-binding protein [Treponema sp.]